MTDLDMMEEISKGYLEIIASRSGYFNSKGRDYGTDLTIRKANLCPTRKRYLTSGKAIDIQVKAVYETYIYDYEDESKDHIKYDVESKTYNDLVDRANENGSILPLILAVFIMPPNPENWISISPNDLIVRKCGYWFQIPSDAVHTTNKATVRIEIPKSNRIASNFYDNMFNNLD